MCGILGRVLWFHVQDSGPSSLLIAEADLKIIIENLNHEAAEFGHVPVASPLSRIFAVSRGQHKDIKVS